MRPRHGDDLRFVLAPVGLPEEGVGLLDAPLAGRLPALDVEVEVRPAAARALLAEHADLLARPDPPPRADRRVDRLQVGVAVEPPVGVEDVDVVVIAALVEGDVGILGQRLPARRDDEAVARRDDLHQALAAADIQAGVVVDRPAGRGVAAVDERGLVGHLRRAGEPALLDRVDERPRRRPGRALGPEPQPRVLVKAPGVLEGIAILVIAPGHRAIDLHAADGHRQAIVGGDQRRGLAVDLDYHAGLADGRAHAVPLLLHVEQLDSGPGPVGELDELRFAAIEIDCPEQRLAPGLLLPGRLSDREGGEQCEYELHRAPQAEAAAMRTSRLPEQSV